MSNRSFATRYNGSSSVGGGGGSDLFGLKAKRQKDVMMLQQAQELERIKAQASADKDVDTNAGAVKDKSATLEVGLAAAKANGLVPANMSIDVIPADMRDAINELGKTHLALQQKTQDSPEFQKSFMSGAASLQAKPTFDNNETAARTQALSTTTVPPNTGVRIGAPGGDFSAKPQDLFGGTQQTQVVGGYKMPDGTTVGGHPMETYGKPSFPPVGKISLGDSQNLTNNVQSTPTDQFANPALDAILNKPYVPPQPSVPSTPDVLTKPANGMVSDLNTSNAAQPGSGQFDPWIKWLLQRAMTPQQQTPTSSPFGLH